jgi:hypothetical protein
LSWVDALWLKLFDEGSNRRTRKIERAPTLTRQAAWIREAAFKMKTSILIVSRGVFPGGEVVPARFCVMDAV